MNDSSRFEITGAITQKYVAPSGKFAFLKVETKIDGFRALHEMKIFDAGVCRQISTAGIGEMVKVEGSIGNEVLKNKAKEPIEVDGRKVYTAVLKVTSIAAVVAKEETKVDPTEDDGDSIPF